MHGYIFRDLAEKDKLSCEDLWSCREPIVDTLPEKLTWTSADCIENSQIIDYVTKMLCEVGLWRAFSLE